jgi:hypothetical protein
VGEHVGYLAEFTGPKAMSEQDLCIAVGEDLTLHYPGHPWLVGCNLEAGTVAIDLGYTKPKPLQNMAYMLHCATLVSPGAQARVMRAGGEILERFGLPRGPARKGSGEVAYEHGLIADDTAEGAHALRKAGVMG